MSNLTLLFLYWVELVRVGLGQNYHVKILYYHVKILEICQNLYYHLLFILAFNPCEARASI